MKRTIAISLCLILLMSNVGITMATHFCGGHAVMSQLMLGHDLLDCGMPEMSAEENPLSGTHFQASDCCENHYQAFDVEDDFRSGVVTSDVDLTFVAGWVTAYLNVVDFQEPVAPPFSPYSPPLLLQDLTILNQVFLI